MDEVIERERGGRGREKERGRERVSLDVYK